MIAATQTPWEERFGIGGSQAAAACGLSPYKPPITLWQELRGELPPFDGNEKTHWGIVLEGPIRQEYSTRNNAKIVVPSESIYRADDQSWMRATPDGIVLGLDEAWSRGYEGKNVGLRMAPQWGEEGSEDIPPLYEVQCRWSMAITELSRWDVAVLIGGQEYREYSIERDLDIEDALICEATDFWNRCVLGGEPPEPDATSEYSRYLAAKFAEPRPEFLQATVELDGSICDLVDTRAAVKRLLERKKWLENHVRFAIADHAGVECSLGRIRNSTVKGRTKTDWKAIAEEALLQLGLNNIDIGKTRAELIESFTSEGAPHSRFYLPKGV